jgi:hypothetical protein
MNRWKKILLFTFALALLVPALPASAAPGRGGHGGGGGGRGHGGGGWGGRTRVFIGVGGGWGWGYWGWPGYYGYYGPGYGYYGGYGRPYAYGPASNWAVIDTDIAPEEAQVYLDGRYIGTADDFDGNPDYLYLKPGRYRIEFRLEGFATLTRQIEARPGMKLDFKDKLHRIAGAKQYGSYERPRPQGGEVRRYFGRNRDSVEAIEPSEQPADAEAIAAEGDADNDDADVQAEPAPAPAPAPRMRRDRDSYGERWRGGDRSRAESRTRLRLNIEPADAAVYVDNRFVGTAEEVNSLERGVSITPGKHSVTVSRPGFRDKTLDITVDQGKTETMEISLNR